MIERLNYLIVLSTIVILCLACGDDEGEAQESIMGDWRITNILSEYGNFSQMELGSSFDVEQTVTDGSDAGSFRFTESSVSYSFTRNDSLFTGTENWSLELLKENQGFVRVNKYSLTISDEFLFDVSFEDSTQNAQKDAKNMTWHQEPTISGKALRIEMMLKKEN